MAAPDHRAGDHAARASLSAAIDPGRDLRKPGPLIAVVERMSGARLGDSRFRMELVTFLQWPAELLRERCCDRRLPAARDPSDDEDWANADDVGLICR